MPDRVILLAWVLMLAGLGAVGLWRASGPVPDKDFSLFYQAARHWLEHGEPGGLAWYHPFALRAFAPLGWLGPRLAGVVWVTSNLASLVALARLGAQRVGSESRSWQRELFPLALLVVPCFVTFYVNQFIVPIVVLLLLAERALERGRWLGAGLWLGLSILLKLSPALLCGWLLLKRSWRALGSTVGLVLLLGPGLDLVTAGFERGLGWQEQWYERIRWSGSAWSVLVAGSQCEYSNHALVAVLRRLLYPTDSTPYFDLQAGREPPAAQIAPINLVQLPLGAVTAVWATLTGAVLLALVLGGRRPARACSTERLRWEYAVWCVAMLWLMPVVRQYHYLLAYPLVSLLWARLEQEWQRRGRFPLRSMPVWTLGAWVITMLFSSPRLAQEIGLPMLGLSALGAGGLFVLARTDRQPGLVEPGRES